MKAIIVDFDGDYLIVANSRGDFKRIYNNYTGYQMGDEITIKNSRASILGSMLSSMPCRKALAIAACFLLMIVTSYGIYEHVNPVTYVTVDINPSVELSLNRYNLVTEAKGLNHEGNVIVGNGKEYRNMKLDKAINMLLSRAMESNYLNMNTNTVMLTVSNVKDIISPNMEKQLKEMAETGLRAIDEKTHNTPSQKSGFKSLGIESSDSTETKNGDPVIIVENTTFEKHQEAKKKNISQGKLVLYDKLKNVKPDAVLNHVKEASVAQIIKEIEKINLEHTEKPVSKGKGQSDDKKQQFKDIKTLEKDMKNQLKDKKKDNKNLLKGEIKKTQDQMKNIIKDMTKEADKILKNESKLKKESIKEQKDDLKINGKLDKNIGSGKGKKKMPDVNDRSNNDKNKGKNKAKPKNNKK